MAAVHSLLFIEDDDQIRLALRMALEDEGYWSARPPTGASGLGSFAEREADLVLLDLRLPDMSGFDVCRALRAASIVPIIIITAQTDTYDLVAGLEAAPTTTSPSPSCPRSWRRGSGPAAPGRLQGRLGAPAPRFGDVELRREQGIVLKGGDEVNLTKTEFRLLCEFADHAGGSSRGTSCSSGSGATSTSATRGSSTPTCAASGSRSRTSPTTRA